MYVDDLNFGEQRMVLKMDPKDREDFLNAEQESTERRDLMDGYAHQPMDAKEKKRWKFMSRDDKDGRHGTRS